MTASRTDAPELLAPAGSLEGLRAAVANGANAVYLGVEEFNARRGAENFKLETLSDTCRYAHLHEVKVYLTANVVVLQHELTDILNMVDRAWESGIDAVIVQDLGVLLAINRTMPHVRVHASTQINAHNSMTLGTLASMGVSRATLAREVSIEEIASFARRDDIEVETFVHGALCVCHSGQCLMSSVIGRRSANRGLCAQPCRLPYELLDREGAPIETPGAHLLSPKDLAGIGMLPDLVRAGVAALKIEGRMKSAEYVALVTGTYRAALDRAVADPEGFSVRDGEQAVLEESFSRGFSQAYLVGERGNAMMSYQRPNNRGVPVGRVVSVASGLATIDFGISVDAEDTLEFWTSAGRFAQAAGPLELAGSVVRAVPAGARAALRLEHSAIAGDRVFRVRNASLTQAARRTFAASGDADSMPLSFSVRVVAASPLSVEVRDCRGVVGVAEGPIVEPARTKAVTAEEVAEHIGRLGGTPYWIEAWNLEMSPNVGVGFSALHRVRRDAIEAYESALLAPWRDRRRVHPAVPAVMGGRSRAPRRQPLVFAAVEDSDVAKACLEAGADFVHIPTYALRPHDAELPGMVPLLPRIAHDRECGAILSHVREGGRVVVGNLGLLAEASRRGAATEAHWSLNALNSLSVEQLAGMGASLVWLSPELSGHQIEQIVSASQVPVGIAVYGHHEVMVTEHCVLMAEGDCKRSCGTCSRRRTKHTLRDRKDYEFPIQTDTTGRTHIYNAVPLDLSAALPELLATGVEALRLDLAVESPQEAAQQVRRVRMALGIALAGSVPPRRDDGVATTTGHFFRGAI
ncbi:MAG: U32 family peptidase [Coriobacteriia bacterium]|nr:U32 family peptidase [Coriobacteriia bacterium]